MKVETDYRIVFVLHCPHKESYTAFALSMPNLCTPMEGKAPVQFPRTTDENSSSGNLIRSPASVPYNLLDDSVPQALQKNTLSARKSAKNSHQIVP